MVNLAERNRLFVKIGVTEERKGEVAEWFKAHAWKACFRGSGSRVRIPSSPQRDKTNKRKIKLENKKYFKF